MSTRQEGVVARREAGDPARAEWVQACSISFCTITSANATRHVCKVFSSHFVKHCIATKAKDRSVEPQTYLHARCDDERTVVFALQLRCQHLMLLTVNVAIADLVRD